MVDLSVDFDKEAAMEWLRKVSPRRVLIQSPLGLRALAERLDKFVKEWGAESFISSSPTWGGCDIAVEEAKRVGAEGIIHIGHAPFLSQTELPVLYIEARYRDYKPLKDMVESVASALGNHKRVGVGFTVQWLDHLARFMNDLSAKGFAVLAGEPGGHLSHRGQILGCDYTSLKSIEPLVDCFLVVGSVFHALGAALVSEKPTLMVDPHTQRVEWMGDKAKRILASRYHMITRFQRARRVAIIVSRKPGQYLMGLAQKLKKLLNDKGMEAAIIVSDEITTENLSDFSFDAYVNTACPRLSIEDQARFSKPLLLPVEVLVALEEISWDEVLRNGLLLNMSLKSSIT
ncbi:MAG: diphthamide biosynthesis enzyme Dph2 [Nitrososphaerota archaeon]|nr:diphthamide biosynthesis enzyme Dph2 [Candidatus Calditenuaceae archaeon]MDW8073187.1 diphthamide biosynthesis enzyme Dph2 [Nitrososphaerota archaeon]